MKLFLFCYTFAEPLLHRRWHVHVLPCVTCTCHLRWSKGVGTALLHRRWYVILLESSLGHAYTKKGYAFASLITYHVPLLNLCTLCRAYTFASPKVTRARDAKGNTEGDTWGKGNTFARCAVRCLHLCTYFTEGDTWGKTFARRAVPTPEVRQRATPMPHTGTWYVIRGARARSKIVRAVPVPVPIRAKGKGQRAKPLHILHLCRHLRWSSGTWYVRQHVR